MKVVKTTFYLTIELLTVFHKNFFRKQLSFHLCFIRFTSSAGSTSVAKFRNGTLSHFISTISVYRISEQSYGLKIWIFWTTIYKLTNNQKPYLSFENIINGSEIAGIVYLSYFRVFDNIQVKKFFSRVCLCDEKSSFWKHCRGSEVVNLLRSEQIWNFFAILVYLKNEKKILFIPLNS